MGYHDHDRTRCGKREKSKERKKEIHDISTNECQKENEKDRSIKNVSM